MGKKISLAEKKKKLKDEEVRVVFQLKIDAMSDGSIRVDGPIHDPVLFMRIIAGSMDAVINYQNSPEKLNIDIENQRKEKEEKRIITPGGPAGSIIQ